MTYENATRILYARYEKLSDMIDDKRKEQENLEREVQEARIEVAKARAVIQSKMDRLTAEASEIKDAMDELGRADGS